MLSASDAGRVGRLILPKRCAEVRTYIFCALTHFNSKIFYVEMFCFELKNMSCCSYEFCKHIKSLYTLLSDSSVCVHLTNPLDLSNHVFEVKSKGVRIYNWKFGADTVIVLKLLCFFEVVRHSLFVN